MSRFKTYYLFVESKLDFPPHALVEELDKDREHIGRSCQTWATAEDHLRRLMKKGYVVRVYEVGA